MSLVKYYVASYSDAISRVEITRETDKFVWVKPINTKLPDNKCAKRTEWSGYFDSFEEAKAWRVKIATDRIESLERGLDDARLRLIKAEALQLEEDAP